MDVGKAYYSEFDPQAAAKWCPAWTRHDFDLPNNASGGKDKRRMVECVWCNFAS